ncbi:hypothetical protein BH20ACT17_BH20ACT17_13130 [soil metagenome]
MRSDADKAMVRQLLASGYSDRLVADIRGLFCRACDALGVRWTLSNPRNVSVSHCTSVALLDKLGCKKD